MAGDWDVARMTGRIPHPYSLADAQEWIGQTDGESAFGIAYRWRLVGVCGYMATGQHEAEIGYWLGKRWWGRGLATEAVQLLVQHCFETGFHRLTCGHFVDNPASQRVIQKLGFEPVGDGAVWCEARGQNVPVKTYRLLAPATASAHTGASAPTQDARS
jgi:RimJ/RimL family protein N-acetyltransferase